MISVDQSFVCSSCDVCGQVKPADLMCTTIVSPEEPQPEKVCWCVCSDCISIIEHVDAFYHEKTQS